MKVKKVTARKKLAARLRSLATKDEESDVEAKPSEMVEGKPFLFTDARGENYAPGMVGWVRPSAPQA